MSLLRITFFPLAFVAACFCLQAQTSGPPERLHSTATPGWPGGRLSIATRAEPKTFNPVIAIDQPSILIFRRMMADLIHINRSTLKTEPALAKSWTVSADGRQFTLELRKGLKFSDGVPFDADDVVFSFKVYEDEKVQAPQRSLLMVAGQPIRAEKINAWRVRFFLASPYAAAERVFDSIAMLPRHLLEKDYAEGRMAQAWGLNTPPEKIAGLGPFRLKKFVPGERTILERNPYYWKVDAKGQQLPYLEELTFLFVPSQDAEVVRFRAGDTQITGSLSAETFNALLKDQSEAGLKLVDAGPGLEYNFLLFNLNSDTEGRFPEVVRHQKWFSDVRFRQAVSAAVDRDAIVRLVYQGRASALATHVTSALKLWINPAIPAPTRSLERARQLLKSAGFSWDREGALTDASGQKVEFSILVSSSNGQRSQMAALVQEDLRHLGMKVSVASMEFRAMLDRVSESHNFDTAIMGFNSGDADPNPAMDVWMSKGKTHFWRMNENPAANTWQAELDSLLEKQLVTMNYQQRKKLYDRVQQIAAEQLPIICLASPHVLVGARQGLGNFQPAILDHYTLWNVDELFWPPPGGK
ncbi:MAG: ABC transporter substrate-binding protein [Acidobacteriia bacterium]|nr:ABC transporter substrate-binding protein [Terriglobia bacterium]